MVVSRRGHASSAMLHGRRGESLVADHCRVDVERALGRPLLVLLVLLMVLLVLLVLLMVWVVGAWSGLSAIFPGRVVRVCHLVLLEYRCHPISPFGFIRLVLLLGVEYPEFRQLISGRGAAALRDRGSSGGGGGGGFSFLFGREKCQAKCEFAITHQRLSRK